MGCNTHPLGPQEICSTNLTKSACIQGDVQMRGILDRTGTGPTCQLWSLIFFMHLHVLPWYLVYIYIDIYIVLWQDMEVMCTTITGVGTTHVCTSQKFTKYVQQFSAPCSALINSLGSCLCIKSMTTIKSIILS